MNIKILAAIIIILLIIAVAAMAIKHADVKASGDKGLASEWNKDHVIDGDVDFNKFQLLQAVIENRTDWPAGPVEGQIIYRTDLNQLYIYDGASWELFGGARRAVTLIVAASDSLDTEHADYVCDGAADQVEINQAIQALPAAGGMVLLLEGTYNTTGTILIDGNDVTFAGQGAGTKIIETGDNIIILVDTTNRVVIKDLLLYHTGTGTGIKFDSSNYFLVLDVHVGITCTLALEIVSSDYGRVLGNSFVADGIGIVLTGSKNNIINSNFITYPAQGIIITGNSDYNIVSNNQVEGQIRVNDAPSTKNTILGNTSDVPVVDNGTNSEVAHNVEY